MSLTLLQSALIPVWVPLLLAPLVYLLRRMGLVAALIAAATMSFVAWWLVTQPIAPGLTVMGRNLLLTPLTQGLLVALALWLAVAFLFAWRIPQGWSVYPFLLVGYALVCLALLFEELVLQVLLLQVAWLVVILLVQGGTLSNTRAGTRLLVLAVLALPPFLVASSLIEQTVYTPDQPLFVGLIVLSLGLGFSLMLAIIPFHAWLPQAAEDGPPLVAAWLVAGMGGSYLIVLFNLLARYSWLANNIQVKNLLFLGGIILGVVGGILCVTERHLGRLWAYAVLTDLGYALIGLSFSSSIGISAAVLVLGNRLVSLLLAGGALATIRQHATSLDFDYLEGLASRLPVAMLAFALGSLAMFGVPLTGGFPGHWAILRLLMEESVFWVIVLISAAILGTLGFVRAFAVMTRRPDDSTALAQVRREPRIMVVLLTAVALISLTIGLAPQTTAPLLSYLISSFRF